MSSRAGVVVGLEREVYTVSVMARNEVIGVLGVSSG